MNAGLICSDSHNLFAIKILAAMIAEKVQPKAVIVAKRTRPLDLVSLRQEFRKYRKQIIAQGLNNFIYARKHPDAYDKALRKELYSALSVKDYCRKLNIPFFTVSALNSRRCSRLITRLQLNVLVNGGAGIYGKPLLELKDCVLLNGHMGILPFYRGMNVIEWSLLNDGLIGATVHIMDKHIDKGPVIATESMVLSACGSIAELRVQGYDFVAHLFAKTLKKIAQEGLTYKNQDMKGKYWYRMHPLVRKITEQKLAQVASEHYG